MYYAVERLPTNKYQYTFKLRREAAYTGNVNGIIFGDTGNGQGTGIYFIVIYGNLINRFH